MSNIDPIEELRKLLADADHVESYSQGIVACIERLVFLEKDNYLGTLYKTTYVVTGRGAFPIDMLRYTNSWPLDETDTRAIEHSFEDDPRLAIERTITLAKYHRDKTPTLAEDRWKSKFRWSVVHIIDTLER